MVARCCTRRVGLSEAAGADLYRSCSPRSCCAGWGIYRAGWCCCWLLVCGFWSDADAPSLFSSLLLSSQSLLHPLSFFSAPSKLPSIPFQLLGFSSFSSSLFLSCVPPLLLVQPQPPPRLATNPWRAHNSAISLLSASFLLQKTHINNLSLRYIYEILRYIYISTPPILNSQP